MPRLAIFTVDAFSSQPFSGNPAAVVPLTQELDDATMQKLAKEINTPATAFVRPLDAGGDNPWASCGLYSLRWFTRLREVPLCGHATLATAHVIFNNLGHGGGQLDFESLSGTLTVRKDGDQIVMDFPANEATTLTDEEAERLKPVVAAACSGMTVKEVLLSRTLKYLLIRLHDSYSRKDLEGLLPDFSGLKGALEGSPALVVIVTVPGKEGSSYHVFSRVFAPLFGLDEDPVTGSAHTVLGPYWAKHLSIDTLSMRQCSQRGGDVQVRMRGAGRVELVGPATTVLQGHINF